MKAFKSQRFKSRREATCAKKKMRRNRRKHGDSITHWHYVDAVDPRIARALA